MKTSQQWYEELQTLYPDFLVMDPDGWDRRNYQYSWHEELITNEEFEKRLSKSTCQWPYKMIEDIKDIDQQYMRKIANAYIQKGENIARDAAFAGEWSDRGGGAMVREAQAFLAGLDGRLPESLQKFASYIESKEINERAEYARLKAKFGE
jgi:hypothetical protein